MTGRHAPKAAPSGHLTDTQCGRGFPASRGKLITCRECLRKVQGKPQLFNFLHVRGYRLPRHMGGTG